MHIEINTEGFGGGIAVAEYQSDMSNFISDAESLISSFKAVSSSTYALNGGVGTLQSAVNDISSRIQAEVQKKNDAVAIQNKSNDFFDLAIRVDNQVATIVNKNKKEFYRVNSWLKPVTSVDEEVPWYERAWNWLCGAGEAITDRAKNVWNWVSDTVVKAWNGIVEFYQEHKKIMDTALIAVGTVAAIAAVIATGGMALVPLLCTMGTSVATAIAISTMVAVVAVVSTIASSTLNIVDIWCEIDNPVFNVFQKSLNIISTISNLTYSIGNIYNSIKSISPQEYIANQATTNTSISGTTFDDNINLGQDKFSNQRYYSKGEHYDEFTEFWESGGNEYSYINVENPKVEYVNSRDIEGVFLNDSEVKKPSTFWNKRYSRNEYLDYVSSGGINNNPVEVTKINDSFYYFNGDGRHRIIAAQELNIDIPVIIKGMYIK